MAATRTQRLQGYPYTWWRKGNGRTCWASACKPLVRHQYWVPLLNKSSMARRLFDKVLAWSIIFVLQHGSSGNYTGHFDESLEPKRWHYLNVRELQDCFNFSLKKIRKAELNRCKLRFKILLRLFLPLKIVMIETQRLAINSSEGQPPSEDHCWPRIGKGTSYKCIKAREESFNEKA